MIEVYRARQRRGKTTAMVARLIEILVKMQPYYTPADIYTNVYLTNLCPMGAHYMENDELKKTVFRWAEEGWQRKIFLIDELPKVFPARFFGDTQQTKMLLGLFQDEKLQSWFLCSTQMGLGYDKLIRDAHQQTWVPYYNKKTPDELRYTCLDARFLTRTWGRWRGIRAVQSEFSSWQFVR